MRKLTFKNHLFSLAAICGLVVVFASCANEDVVQNLNGTDSDKNLTIFSTGEDPITRTSMESNGTFYWEAGDKIWVKDDDGAWQKSSNSPTSKTASFKFKVPGKFTQSNTYKVYYPGQNGSQNQVTISANQTQTEPNSTAHFGTSGDCGTANATWSNAKGGFAFTLDHQAAYLIFQPYTSNTVLHDCYLTKIEVTSNNDITDTYTLTPSTGALTGTGSGNQIILTTKGSGTYVNGFPLTNSTASVTTNGAYMVIKPGKRRLRIRYWIKDINTNVEGTITKLLSPVTFVKNKYYNITSDLNIREYDGHHYYMWDAAQNFWSGHEWDSADPWQPTLNGESDIHYPHSNLDPRWHNTSIASPSNPCDASTALFQTVPSANELSWYDMCGDPRWDSDELWTTMGGLYKGGMWFKKLSRISLDQGVTIAQMKTRDINNVDMRTHTIIPMTIPYYNTTIGHTLPSVSDQSDYFYLPALGLYSNGSLSGVGQAGAYWSSTAAPTGDNGRAWSMGFSSTSIDLNDFGSRRYNGFIAAPFTSSPTGSGPFFE